MCWLNLLGLGGKAVRIDQVHIARHLTSSTASVLGANIDYAPDVDSLLDRKAVMAFIQGIAYVLENTPDKIQIFELECVDEVGFDGVVAISDLPDGARVWQEDREGFMVNVTDATPPRTHWLTFFFSLKGDQWYLGTIYAGRASPSFTDKEWWNKHAFYNLKGVGGG